MKNARVIMATFKPYLPFLPTRNIATALGDSTSANNISPAPAIRTQSDKSLRPSKAKLMEPPKITAKMPAEPNVMLQKLEDLMDDNIISV
ncbi:uncharacterized protein METZ01_LOCUS395113 [marine metagenome]|uniref:Uncharacterized protein n=1 Tax=marine metagenome TaxID=408172 RepID=A0A382V6Y3_9ZZZZ